MANEESNYVNPFTDYGFKRIFGQEDSKIILRDFLNSLFNGDPYIETIEEIQYLDKEQIGELKEERIEIYDIYCKIGGNKRIIVEMQNHHQQNYRKRSLIYMGRAINSQALKGKDYEYEFEPVIAVHLANFRIPGGKPKAVTKVVPVDVDDNEPYFPEICWYFIQFPYVTQTDITKCETPTEEWLYSIKNHKEMDRISRIKPSPAFLELERLANISNLSPDQKRQYEVSLKYYRDRNHEYNSALNLGYQEGRAKGMAEGRAEGEAEERTRTLKRMIPRLRGKGFSNDEIIEDLEMTPEEVSKYLK